MKGKIIKSILMLVVFMGLAACDRSSFKIRDGKNSDILTENQPTECTTNCDENPGDPDDYPENPDDTGYDDPSEEGPYYCKYENELFGSVAHITHGEHSKEIIWNYFPEIKNKRLQIKYYQVEIMDASKNTFQSEYLPYNKTSYLIHPHAKGIDGQTLAEKGITLEQGKWYWYRLIALDKNYYEVMDRELDLPFSTYQGEFNRFVGFCSGYDNNPPVDNPVDYDPSEDTNYDEGSNGDDNDDSHTDETTQYPPANGDDDKFYCRWQNEVFGSVADITQGHQSQLILWNHFAEEKNKNLKLKYYQVVVMDAAMTTFKSKLLPFSQNSYLVHPHDPGQNGETLTSLKIDFQQGNWYWYKLLALDEYKNVIIERKLDLLFSPHKGEFNRFVGFCGEQPY